MPSGVTQSSASRSPPGADVRRRHARRRALRDRRRTAVSSAALAAADVLADYRGAAAATIAAMPRPAVSLVAAVARDGGIGHARRPARSPAGRPAPLQADHARHADRDGPEDLAVDRPAAARAAQHRRQPRPGLSRGGRGNRHLARRGARARRRGTARPCHRRRRDLRAGPAGRRRAAAHRDRRRVPGRHVLPGLGPQPLRRGRARAAPRRPTACATPSSPTRSSEGD